MKTFSVTDPEGLVKVSQYLYSEYRSEPVVVFKGEMGAGKTTLIKDYCRFCGVSSSMGSPTFSLINEYETDDGELLYHFDFYRLETEEEAFDYGYEEYFYSGDQCLVEWPEKIPNLLPRSYVQVSIAVDGANRAIKICKV